jgi:predicted TIM-barrel fold metal-dependent hydrolase
MIVDIHTHIFPPAFIRDRARLAAHDPQFGVMYADDRARMATAEDLRASMRGAGVDVSVACGFWWADPALAEEHADYLGRVAAESDGAIVAFGPTFEASPGCAGIGEVRLGDPSAFPLVDRPLLVHCSEDTGHEYPGKTGGLTAGGVLRVLEASSEARVIAAHWGAGLPFFALMPEVARLLQEDRLLVDTAASAYLYAPAVFATAIDLIGAERIAWGSDYPLRPQALDLAEARAALPSRHGGAARDAILGANAARFLGLRAD